MIKFKTFLKYFFSIIIFLIFSYFTFFSEKGNRMIFFQLIGGLSIFLFGMSEMTTGLETLAGEKIKSFFERFTSNPIMALFTGVVVTSLIQSSSATTVLVVGFVNAAMMNLTQAAGVIIGANIGTTVTGQLIAFKISKYAFLLIAIGALLFFLTKSRRYRMFGRVLIGFGLLFVGMDLMKEVVAPLKNSPEIISWISSLSGNILMGVFVGTIFTFILQSSSATVAITMTMAGSGLIDFPTSVALILGDNIGTTITAQLAALPAKRNAKRAALLHTIFNVFGVLIIVSIFPYYVKFVQKISPVGTGMERLVANAHTIFNVMNALIFIPFTSFLASICYFLIPKTEDEKFSDSNFLDKRLLEIPAMAIDAAEKESLRMAELTSENIKDSIISVENFDYSIMKKVVEREKLIDSSENDIVNYLVLVEEKNITKDISKKIVDLIELTGNLERISDQCENIEELLLDKYERKIKFSETANNELIKMKNMVLEIFDISCKAYQNRDDKLVKKVFELEENINKLEKKAKKEHVDRLCSGQCSHVTGYFYTELMETLEKIGDHCKNIAELILP